jgi:hypothetical protein
VKFKRKKRGEESKKKVFLVNVAENPSWGMATLDWGRGSAMGENKLPLGILPCHSMSVMRQYSTKSSF